MSKTRILIVDDHAILRMGLASLLNAKRDFEVVGDAANGKSGIRKALKLKPDVVIMDLQMPAMDGVETTKLLLAQDPEAKVLVLTTFAISDGIASALDAGAKGAVLKNCDFDDLAAAIRAVSAGQRYVSPEIARLFSADPPIAPLSPRQAEILAAFVRGLTNPEIASFLGVSLDMVKEHSTALFQKLGVSNRTEAVAIALKKHLLPAAESSPKN